MAKLVYLTSLLALRGVLAATGRDFETGMSRTLDYMRDVPNKPEANPPQHRENPVRLGEPPGPTSRGPSQPADDSPSEKPVVKEGHSPSKFDPLASHYFKGDPIAKGYAKDHYAPSNVEKFGNISMLSLNAHTVKDTLEEQQQSLILELIDTHHPAIFGLQNVSEKTLKFLTEHTKDHYDVANTTQKWVDIGINKDEYKPIFYDRYILERVDEGAFEPKEKNQSYATFAEFRMRGDKESFLVINGDLMSSKSGANDTMAFAIISDIKASGTMISGTKANGDPVYKPVVYLGTIDTTSEELKEMIGDSKANMIEKDGTNEKKKLPKDTLHDPDHKFWKDGVQRDFILLFDEQERFELNYARILSLYNTQFFMHYPVYGIFTKKLHQKN